MRPKHTVPEVQPRQTRRAPATAPPQAWPARSSSVAARPSPPGPPAALGPALSPPHQLPLARQSSRTGPSPTQGPSWAPHGGAGAVRAARWAAGLTRSWPRAPRGGPRSPSAQEDHPRVGAAPARPSTSPRSDERVPASQASSVRASPGAGRGGGAVRAGRAPPRAAVHGPPCPADRRRLCAWSSPHRSDSLSANRAGARSPIQQKRVQGQFLLLRAEEGGAHPPRPVPSSGTPRARAVLGAPPCTSDPLTHLRPLGPWPPLPAGGA